MVSDRPRLCANEECSVCGLGGYRASFAVWGFEFGVGLQGCVGGDAMGNYAVGYSDCDLQVPVKGAMYWRG